ncbi:YqzG/YhdC family protein [Lentibacillus jeotgali]|uniref:YqzG/YhdC family protein n=1 Tax=Lentibacillus jeotgali TaxID=558169 RepID=UPI0002628FEE|nr:YqzG/YhdC family protein [Lentibacillus jeotgali]
MRALSIIFGLIVLLSAVSGTSYMQPIVHADKDIPSYAKWGRLAMKETQSKYPDADIIDYLHRGREDKNETSVEKFKLWLQEDDREFGVFIDIEFNAKTENVVDITFRETSQ